MGTFHRRNDFYIVQTVYFIPPHHTIKSTHHRKHLQFYMSKKPHLNMIYKMTHTHTHTHTDCCCHRRMQTYTYKSIIEVHFKTGSRLNTKYMVVDYHFISASYSNKFQKTPSQNTETLHFSG